MYSGVTKVSGASTARRYTDAANAAVPAASGKLLLAVMCVMPEHTRLATWVPRQTYCEVQQECKIAIKWYVPDEKKGTHSPEKARSRPPVRQ